MSFQGDSGVTPDLGTILVGGKLVAGWAQVTNNPGSLKPDSGILRPKLGVLRLKRGYIGYMVHWKRDYTRMPRSLVAPSRGAGGFFQIARCRKSKDLNLWGKSAAENQEDQL